MSEENEGVEEVESPTTEDVTTESSTEESSEATEQQATPEEQTVPYSRLKEVIDEKNLLLDRITQQPIPQPVQQQTIDPDANLDPQTKIFYQDMDKRNQKAIDSALAVKEKEFQAKFDNLALQTARVQEKLFRQDEKDVIPGSKEENRIAQLISSGLSTDEAAWAVMGKKRVESAKTGKETNQQKKTQLKAEANLETPGIPTNSGVPTGEKLNFREDLDRQMKEHGL